MGRAIATALRTRAQPCAHRRDVPVRSDRSDASHGQVPRSTTRIRAAARHRGFVRRDDPHARRAGRRHRAARCRLRRAEEIARDARAVRPRSHADRSSGRRGSAASARLDFGDSFLYNRPVARAAAAARRSTPRSSRWRRADRRHAARHPARHLHRQPPRRPAAGARARRVAGAAVAAAAAHVAAARVHRRAHGMASGRRHDVGRRASTLGWSAWLADVAWHLPLPALALALPIAATFERLQSQSIERGGAPAVRARRAGARRVARRGIIWRHAWPVSLRPICAVYGLVIGALLSRIVRRRIRDGVAGARPPDVRRAARARHLPRRRLRRDRRGCSSRSARFVADLLLAVADPRVREGDARVRRAGARSLLALRRAACAAAAPWLAPNPPDRRFADLPLRAADARRTWSSERPARAVHLSVSGSSAGSSAASRRTDRAPVPLRWFTGGRLVSVRRGQRPAAAARRRQLRPRHLLAPAVRRARARWRSR